MFLENSFQNNLKLRMFSCFLFFCVSRNLKCSAVWTCKWFLKTNILTKMKHEKWYWDFFSFFQAFFPIIHMILIVNEKKQLINLRHANFSTAKISPFHVKHADMEHEIIFC